ncbi:GNAT family N-acetyltransferase [Streptomyces sp. NPDC002644]
MTTHYEWRGHVQDAELDALHAAAFGHPPGDGGWEAQLNGHSLGWVCARDGGKLVGIVNVAWDGGTHAFLLDTAVTPERQGEGTGAALVRMAAREARAAGCRWLHVDFEESLRPFYVDACGFRPTAAGLLAL